MDEGTGNLLHVAFELINGAFVQVPAEEREQVWGQEERLHQWTLGQLTCHLEYYVGPVKRILKKKSKLLQDFSPDGV